MRAPLASSLRRGLIAFAASSPLLLCGASAPPRHARRAIEAPGPALPRPSVVLAWFADPVATTFPPLIVASCPDRPSIDLPGVLCEGFDTDRNGVAGFQWTRLPVTSDPGDPLRALGDTADDVLGYTQGTGAGPIGTGALTCPGDIGFPNCQAPVAEENDWHLHSPSEGPGDGYDPIGLPGIGAPDGGKAHGGSRSMHMGRHLDPASTLGDTLRFRQVSAFVIDSQGDPNLPGLAIGPASQMEFWHMIDVPDDENFGSGFLPPAGSFGGGQVQISLLGGDGRFDRWRRLRASFNDYDSFDQGTVSLCAFDPGDDRIVPNDLTMCDPAPMWADIGDVNGTDATCQTDTDGNDRLHKDCGDISSCAGGPGCTENGSAGTGVWARSAFDLSPFAGRVARLRWIGMVEGGWSFGTSRSALEPAGGGTPYYFEGDDGWWIDDIVVTDLRVAPLPCGGDADGDGFAFCHGDCDDGHASVHPGAPQICDGLNNDCDHPDWPALGQTEGDLDHDGYGICTGDCDETSRWIYPGAPQICDGVNNDCDDPAWPAVPAVESDADLDGFMICEGDCDDALASVHPGAEQACGDGINNDCSHPWWPSLAATNESDDDGDGLSECAGDCDDARSSVYPGAPQICDGLNNNCNHPAWPAPVPGDTDADLDGFRPCSGDCDDTRQAVYPGAPPICDGLNNDCDDPAWPSVAGTTETDDDGDALSECAGDCDDARSSVYPGAPQICDGLNNDCDDPAWPAPLISDGDFDGDGRFTCAGAYPADCLEGDPGYWSRPGEVTGLLMVLTIVRWTPPADAGGVTLWYDVLRSGDPADFTAGAVCVETLGSHLFAEDTEDPAIDEAFFYLVRARNGCPPPEKYGSIGTASDGTPRAARSCP